MKDMISQISVMAQQSSGGGKVGNGKGSKAAGKPGDWTCQNCGELVFGSKAGCRLCGTPRPGGGQPPNAKPGDWTCPKCFDHIYASRDSCRCGCSKEEAIEAGCLITKGRPGDWTCAGCNNFNFSSRTTCQQCQQPRPEDQVRLNMKPGDWICPSCGDLVFASKSACKMCGTPKPEGLEDAPEDTAKGKSKGGGKGFKARPGDWNCTSCQNLNFSSRTSCKQCGLGRPQDQIRESMKPGDWICPGCGDLVFSSRDACKMCKTLKSTAGPEHFLLGQAKEKQGTANGATGNGGATAAGTTEEQLQQQQLLQLAGTPEGVLQLQQLQQQYAALGYDVSAMQAIIEAGQAGQRSAPY